MDNEQDNKWEQRMRFVVKHYREGCLDEEKAWRRFASRHAIVREISFRRYWIGAAAVILLLLGLGSWFMTERKAPDWVVVTTSSGQMKDVYLPDSTLVTLAEQSRIQYDAKRYDKEIRAVEMRGKIFFQVKRDESCPFSVKASETEVTVLGTSFQVDEQRTMTEVDVVTGKVRFSTEGGDRSMVLTAGMSARYSQEGKDIELLTGTDVNRQAWRTGVLRFKETPLEQVIMVLNEHYGVKVRERTANKKVRLTATFDNLPLDEVLRVINQTLDTHLVSVPEK